MSWKVNPHLAHDISFLSSGSCSGKTSTDTLLFLYLLVSSYILFSLFTLCIGACFCKWGWSLSHVFRRQPICWSVSEVHRLTPNTGGHRPTNDNSAHIYGASFILVPHNRDNRLKVPVTDRETHLWSCCGWFCLCFSLLKAANSQRLANIDRWVAGTFTDEFVSLSHLWLPSVVLPQLRFGCFSLLGHSSKILNTKSLRFVLWRLFVDAHNAIPLRGINLLVNEDVRACVCVCICLSVRQGDFGNQLSDSWVCSGVWPRWLSHQQCSSSRWMSHNLPPWGDFSFQRIFASLQWISASPSIQKWSQAEFKINMLWEFIHKIISLSVKGKKYWPGDSVKLLLRLDAFECLMHE